MLAGVPVVAPDRGGGTEIVRDGVDGVLVDVEDPAALATAIAGLLRDPARAASLAESARRRAETEFTAARMAAQAWAARSLARTRPHSTPTRTRNVAAIAFVRGG